MFWLFILPTSWNYSDLHATTTLDDAYGVDISEPESDPEPEPEPTLIVRAKRGRPSKADIEDRKTLSTTTTTTPSRAPKRSKKY